MEEKLYDAAVIGDEQYLREILKKEPHILHKIAAQNFISTPLHIASLLGHVGFVRVLLGSSPDLAGVLDQRRKSALHLAVDKGDLAVVEALMELEEHGKNMCTAVDDDGRNPVHIAAIKGRDDVLKKLMDVFEADVAQERVKNGQTILHLCVLYRQRKTLMQLLDSKCKELINAVDEWGNTILHLAVADKQDQTVDYLVNFKCERNYEKMNINVTNADGYTALDLLPNSKIEEETKDETNLIKVCLLKRKAKRSKDLIKPQWLTEKRDSLMIVTVLMAAIAFQAGVSPPGGVWQEDTAEHRAGETVIAYTYHKYYSYFIRANTTGFVASLSIIFLLLSDLPFRKKTVMWFLVLVMWLTITCMAFSYAFAITVVSPEIAFTSVKRTIVVAVIVWTSVISLLLIVHSSRLMKRIVDEEVDKRNEYIDAMRALRSRPIKLLSRIYRGFSSH